MKKLISLRKLDTPPKKLEQESKQKPEQKPKETPRYSTWQNTVYVFNLALERKRFLPLVLLVQSMLTPAIPAIAMILPMTVVALILGNGDTRALIMTVLVFTAAAVLLQTAKSYLSAVSKAQRNSLRHSIIQDA